ncbi:MAG: hypothetical protein GWP59_04300 [Chlamydiales bacterium]|nr:hypothetical protein [Chlamydiales bacterium]NCF70905.1 hypothetical protein [Chlamydiales bacterium]
MISEVSTSPEVYKSLDEEIDVGKSKAQIFRKREIESHRASAAFEKELTCLVIDRVFLISISSVISHLVFLNSQKSLKTTIALNCTAILMYNLANSQKWSLTTEVYNFVNKQFSNETFFNSLSWPSFSFPALPWSKAKVEEKQSADEFSESLVEDADELE